MLRWPNRRQTQRIRIALAASVGCGISQPRETVDCHVARKNRKVACWTTVRRITTDTQPPGKYLADLVWTRRTPVLDRDERSGQ